MVESAISIRAVGDFRAADDGWTGGSGQRLWLLLRRVRRRFVELQVHEEALGLVVERGYARALEAIALQRLGVGRVLPVVALEHLVVLPAANLGVGLAVLVLPLP